MHFVILHRALIVVDNKVPGDPPEALASWQGGVLIVVDNKVPGDPPEALASWQGGVLIIDFLTYSRYIFRSLSNAVRYIFFIVFRSSISTYSFD